MLYSSAHNYYPYNASTQYNFQPQQYIQNPPNNAPMVYRGSVGIYQTAQKENLGSGSYGEVVLVQEQRTQKYYAMKIMSKQTIKEIYAEENILQEILIQRELSHSNILRMIETFEDTQNLYMVLEHCSKGTLHQLLKTRGPLTEREAFKYFHQILCGLDYLHLNNIIHRDIKPDNILIAEDGTIKLGDYNWAIKMKGQENVQPVLCGTTEYMPPEVVTKQTHNQKVDVWSLGIVLYEMLHCDLPYKGSNNKEKISSILANSHFKINDKLSQDLQILIHAMLSRVLNQRPTSRQIFFSKWVKNMLQQSRIPHPFDYEEIPLEQQQYLTKSLTQSLVKSPQILEAINKKIQSDIRPMKEPFQFIPSQKQRAAPMKNVHTISTNGTPLGPSKH